MYNFFSTDFTGATLPAETESAVYSLFSQRYRVRKVREGFPTMNGKTFHVYLQDGSELKVHTAHKSGLFGDERVVVNYIE